MLPIDLTLYLNCLIGDLNVVVCDLSLTELSLE